MPLQQEDFASLLTNLRQAKNAPARAIQAGQEQYSAGKNEALQQKLAEFKTKLTAAKLLPGEAVAPLMSKAGINLPEGRPVSDDFAASIAGTVQRAERPVGNPMAMLLAIESLNLRKKDSKLREEERQRDVKKENEVLALPGYTLKEGMRVTPTEASNFRKQLGALDAVSANIGELKGFIQQHGPNAFTDGALKAKLDGLAAQIRTDIKNDIQNLGAAVTDIEEAKFLSRVVDQPNTISSILKEAAYGNSFALGQLDTAVDTLKRAVTRKIGTSYDPVAGKEGAKPGSDEELIQLLEGMLSEGQ